MLLCTLAGLFLGSDFRDPVRESIGVKWADPEWKAEFWEGEYCQENVKGFPSVCKDVFPAAVLTSLRNSDPAITKRAFSDCDKYVAMAYGDGVILKGMGGICPAGHTIQSPCGLYLLL